MLYIHIQKIFRYTNIYVLQILLFSPIYKIFYLGQISEIEKVNIYLTYLIFCIK